MARLPQPGGDAGNWGDILNDYLAQSHKSDGTIKDNAVTATALAPDSVSATTIVDGSVTEALLASAVQTKLNAAGANATTATVGMVQLAGDLGGTATTPTVPLLATKVSKGELIYNVKDYGAVGNGTTDDGAAIDAALAAMTTITGSDNAVGVLYFPPGRYIDSHNHTIAANRRIHIQGAQVYTSILKRPAGAAGDWWTIAANSAGISNLTLEGGRYQGATGDAVVLDGSYNYLTDVNIIKAGGNGLSVGKSGAAIAVRITNTSIGECAGYGAIIVGGSGATDGMWVNNVISICGLSGFKVEESAQNVLNMHVWGCGVESTSDYHGIWVAATGCLFSNWQSEKNLGAGLYLQGGNNQFTGGRAWGNGLAGIRMLSAARNTFTGNGIYWNGVKNTGTSTISFSGIHVDGASVENVFSGNASWDSATAIPAANYVTAPTYPYTGRTASISQPYAYAEGGSTADSNVLTGNSFRKERTLTGSLINVGNNNIWSGNDLGSTVVPTRSVVTGTVRVPAESDTIIISVSQEVTNVVGHRPGRVARLIWTNASPQPIRDNGTTLNLNGDFTPTQNDTMTLISDGTNWYEIARSAN